MIGLNAGDTLETIIKYLEDNNKTAIVRSMELRQEGGVYCQAETTLSLELSVFEKTSTKQKSSKPWAVMFDTAAEAQDHMEEGRVCITNKPDPFDKAMDIIK